MSLENSTGAVSHRIHFRDARPPEQIQFQLERDLVALFQPVGGEDRPAAFRGMAKYGHTPYFYTLTFEAALANENCYSLQLSASWADRPPRDHAEYRRETESWFAFYTRNFKPAPAPAPDEGSAERYRILARQWLSAEAHLDSVAAVQQAILNAMRAGSTFSRCTKEGNWAIWYANGRFHGDKPYRDEQAFLKWLRAYFDVQTSHAIWPEKVPEYDAWKLMLRLLEPGDWQKLTSAPGLRWLASLLNWLRN